MNARGLSEQARLPLSEETTAMNGGSRERVILLQQCGALLQQCGAFEVAVAELAAAMPPEAREAFTENAVEKILIDFAQRARGPGAPSVHMALGAHLRDGIRRCLDDFGNQ